MDPKKTWKLALLIWLAVVILSSTSEVAEIGADVYRNYLRDAGRTLGISSHDAQKSLHVVLFGVLGWLLAYTHLPPRSPWVRGLVWSFAVGSVTEIIQLLVRGREPLFSDVILNGVAGTLSCWLTLWAASRGSLETDEAS